MTDRERVCAMMGYETFDRPCMYYFREWDETRQRGLAEGLSPDRPISVQVGLDPDWAPGLSVTHGLRAYKPNHH